MESFHCYDNSDVIATLMVAVFPNVCLWRRSLCSDLVLTIKNCVEPPSYARTAYVVAIWPSLLFDSFVKIWATCEVFLGKWFTPPPPLAKNFPYAYVNLYRVRGGYCCYPGENTLTSQYCFYKKRPGKKDLSSRSVRRFCLKNGQGIHAENHL